MLNETPLSYSDGNLNFEGLVVRDPSLSGTLPGVLVFHEAWGLGNHAIERARMLARLGYVAFAADMFGERRQVKNLKEMIQQVGPMVEDRELTRSRAQAAVLAFKNCPQVDQAKICAIGFCFGGLVCLELARCGCDIRGVVSFHGRLHRSDSAATGKISTKILVCTGAEDPHVPDEQIAEFIAEMREADADWELQIYGRAKHSFTNPDAPQDNEIPGLEYDPEADRRSWNSMRDFLQEAFAIA